MLVGGLKSLHSLWVNLATNQRYSRFVLPEDIRTFTTRCENEGLSFLTTVLPKLGKALDGFHSSQEWISPPDFCTGRDGFPVFLQVPIRLALRGDSLAVDCVRQLTLIFYKLEVIHDKETVRDFLSHFISVDSQSFMPSGNVYDLPDHIQAHIGMMRRIIGRILCNANPLDIRPSHGSGSTACRTANSDKHHIVQYFSELDDVYCYSDYFFYNINHLVDEYEKLVDSVTMRPRARVVLVPKDSRGPRVISCEPAALMYIQQGIMKLLYDTIETHALTGSYCNFTDQSINRRLAREGSLHDNYATLDLSDASDRVSLNLVRSVFPPNWVRCLEASRSKETILPDGQVVELNKFAPMGSSCCFPVEALIFWVSALASTVAVDRNSSDLPYVYGDDIIIRPAYAERVMEDLESIGLVVNRNKSFVKGPFRESCGGDFHNGMDVTPVRVRKFLSVENTDLATTANLINSIIDKFGYESAHQCIRAIEDSVSYTYPRSELPFPTAIRTAPSASNDVLYRRRWNSNFQRYEHRIPTVAFKKRQYHPAGWSELLRMELSRELRQGSPGKYFNPLKVEDQKLEPGWYTDAHSVHRKWCWTWLG